MKKAKRGNIKRHNMLHILTIQRINTEYIKKLRIPRLFAMRRYGGGMLYAALPLHMQRGYFRIRTHDQQVTKAQPAPVLALY